MPSSVIRSYRYDVKREQLWVTSVTGRNYVYDRVPASVHEALGQASSKGAFFNRFIRDRFPCREVRQAG